nr:MAG TPA: hypothetical protein [Caudoviricetes sp.]
MSWTLGYIIPIITVSIYALQRLNDNLTFSVLAYLNHYTDLAFTDFP